MTLRPSLWHITRERTGPEPVSELSITASIRIGLHSPDPATVYRLRGDGLLHSGAGARSAGVVVPRAFTDDTDVLVFDPRPTVT
jgi:hypothetical protein